MNAQRVAGLVKTAETMGILDTTSEATKQTDIDEILGFLASLEKVWMYVIGQIKQVQQGRDLATLYLSAGLDLATHIADTAIRVLE